MIIWILAATLQCLILYAFWRGARAVVLQKVPSNAPAPMPESPPTVAMIIPAAGSSPLMPKALTSLLEQDYAPLIPVMVVAHTQDPAHALALELQQKYPLLEVVVAGTAQHCGQKNHNTLKALEHINNRADIYLFCDSTHTAQPNFVRELAGPIITNEAGFTTGYHEVVAKDTQSVSLAYEISVLLMRFLQAASFFTQPWGGAMAMARTVFEKYQLADLWKNNVVDDCSLGAFLLKKRLHVQLCPHAILQTPCANHALAVWQAWMQRQVLFLKFCVFSQWLLLGFFACLMTIPVLISYLCLLAGMSDTLPITAGWAVFFAAVHLFALSAIILGWRECSPRKVSTWPWLKAFYLSSFMFFKVFLLTLRAWHIDWHGIRYYVTKGGKVRRMEKYK